MSLNISGELRWIFQVVGGIKNSYQLSSRGDVQDDAMSSVVIMMIITKITLEISVKIWKMLENVVDILCVNFKPNR